MKPRGRHPHHRLTPVSVKAKREGRYADGNGLYLVVDSSGARRWIWRGVIPGTGKDGKGKRSELGLGGITVSLATARREAAGCKEMVRKGENPRLVRQRQRRAVPTFREAARQVHAAHSATFRNPKHRADWLSSLELNVFSLIGDRPVNTLDSSDMLRVLSPIWLVKPETARRIKQRMKVVFDWAKASGFREGDNPTDGLTKVLPRHEDDKQHHAALPYAQVPAFITALRASAAHQTIRFAFEFLILTATRTNEVLGARWDEVDLQSRTWTIPGTRMKSRRPHRVPLSARAVEILTPRQAAPTRSPYVFPGRTPTQPLSNMVFLMTLRRMQQDTITAHGFRSTFRDWAEERTHAPRAVCEAALAHAVEDKTEAAYKRTDLFEKRRALMDLWSAYVTGTPATVLVMPA